MSVNPQQVNAQQKIIDAMNKHHVHPPIVYLILGLICLGFWALGTSTQVLTSEAWIMHQTMKNISITAYGQLWSIITTQQTDVPLIPFMFGWGVQLALIVAAIGVELPRKPAWRFRLAAGSSLALIVANSCGDWVGSSDYGFWGQMGFTAVIFFMTFVMLILAIESLKKAWARAAVHGQ
jgi:hypothetical protein